MKKDKQKETVKWDGVFSPTCPIGLEPEEWASQNLHMRGLYDGFCKFPCPLCGGACEIIITKNDFYCEDCDLSGKTAVELRDILTKYGSYERPNKPYVVCEKK